MKRGNSVFSSMQNFEKLAVNITPESIYMKEEKNMGSRNTQTFIYT